jgi:hypothetical protein
MQMEIGGGMQAIIGAGAAFAEAVVPAMRALATSTVADTVSRMRRHMT